MLRDLSYIDSLNMHLALSIYVLSSVYVISVVHEHISNIIAWDKMNIGVSDSLANVGETDFCTFIHPHFKM